LGRGRPSFPRNCTCSAVLTHRPRADTLSPTGLSPPAVAPSSGVRVRRRLLTRRGPLPRPRAGRPTPARHRPAGHSVAPVWAARVSLAATPRILSFPRGTEMFQLPRCPPRALCVQARAPRYHPRRVDPFGDPRIIACQPLPEALRRVAAPFVGPASRGIHLRAHPSSPATRLPRDGRAIGRAPTRGKLCRRGARAQRPGPRGVCEASEASTMSTPRLSASPRVDRGPRHPVICGGSYSLSGWGHSSRGGLPA
jgi:hypothetical protein